MSQDETWEPEWSRPQALARDMVSQDETWEPELSLAQAVAIEALSGGATVTAAADVAGVARRTLHRWLAEDAEFLAALNREKHERLGQLRGQLRGLAADAITTLASLLDPNRDLPDGIRLRAAIAVLSMVGADRPEPIGATDAFRIQHEQGLKEVIRALFSE
jgi:hypothetical protein